MVEHWRPFALSMHIFLAILHLSSLLELGGNYITIILNAFRILLILAEVLNFIIAITLFSRTPPYNELETNEEKRLKTWLLLEVIMIVCLVSSNVIMLFIRAGFVRPKLLLSGIESS